MGLERMTEIQAKTLAAALDGEPASLEPPKVRARPRLPAAKWCGLSAEHAGPSP